MNLKRKEQLNTRKLQMIHGIVLQGGSVEEIAYFLNMERNKLLELMDFECIEPIITRQLTVYKKEKLEETKENFINKFYTEENLKVEEIAYIFNLTNKEVKKYLEPENPFKDFRKYCLEIGVNPYN